MPKKVHTQCMLSSNSNSIVVNSPVHNKLYTGNVVERMQASVVKSTGVLRSGGTVGPDDAAPVDFI